MPSTIDHVLLTRFNLPSVGVESVVRAQEGWLRTRIELFERYCVPSVRAQTNENFTWVIYFDPESPPWLLERIEEYRAAGTFTPLFRPSFSHSELISDLRSVVGTPRSELITTNLDNDDGLAIDFVDRLQSGQAPSAPTALYLTRGLILSPAGLYLRFDRHNAFCSVRESWTAEPRTCWLDWHDLLPRHLPVRELAGRPGWLQVVHGTNVSNKVHGRLSAPGPYRELFLGLLDDIPNPQPAAVLRDRLVAQPLRGIRDWLRAAVKRMGRAILGKDGWDRAKHRVATWRPPAVH